MGLGRFLVVCDRTKYDVTVASSPAPNTLYSGLSASRFPSEHISLFVGTIIPLIRGLVLVSLYLYADSAVDVVLWSESDCLPYSSQSPYPAPELYHFRSPSLRSLLTSVYESSRAVSRILRSNGLSIPSPPSHARYHRVLFLGLEIRVYCSFPGAPDTVSRFIAVLYIISLTWCYYASSELAPVRLMRACRRLITQRIPDDTHHHRCNTS